MSFWQPARMEENKQLEIDTRVILGIAEEKLKKDLSKVESNIEKHREKFIGQDVFSITRKQRANMNTRADNLAFERNEILRRLDLIGEMRGRVNE